MTAMQTISIQVSPEAAKAYRNASGPEKKKLELLLSLRLLDAAVRPQKSLEEVMKKTSRSARKKRLTPDILEDLLKD